MGQFDVHVDSQIDDLIFTCLTHILLIPLLEFVRRSYYTHTTLVLLKIFKLSMNKV